MSKKKQYKKPLIQNSNILLYVAIAVAVIAIAVVFIKPKGDNENNLANNSVNNSATSKETTETTDTPDSSTENTASSDTSVPVALNETGDVVIQIADITETATFYSYDSNGTKMGLFAVKASDGTVRTALNTCQICNGSPYAYFTQQDDTFQCLNCGNIYSLDMIEQERGGCNPVPIMADEKTVTDKEIIIPAKFFEDNAQRFENWKKF